MPQAFAGRQEEHSSLLDRVAEGRCQKALTILASSRSPHCIRDSCKISAPMKKCRFAICALFSKHGGGLYAHQSDPRGLTAVVRVAVGTNDYQQWISGKDEVHYWPRCPPLGTFCYYRRCRAGERTGAVWRVRCNRSSGAPLRSGDVKCATNFVVNHALRCMCLASCAAAAVVESGTI